MINLRGLKFKNRITISPMCQYSSKNGAPSEWHYHHLRNLIETGAGSLVIESTAISREGRITNKDLCLFNKKQMKEHSKLLDYLKKINNIPIILQISHSGRKGSAEVPFIKKIHHSTINQNGKHMHPQLYDVKKIGQYQKSYQRKKF